MSDEPVSSLADQLRQAATAVPTGPMSDVADELESIGTQLTDLDDECTALAAHLASSATETFRLMVGVRKALHDLSDHHDGGGSGGGGSASPAEPARPGPPPSVQAPDGSRYPADAQDPHLLSSPPGEGDRDRTEGNASVNGHSIGKITSGKVDPTTRQPDPYFLRARKRLEACGLSKWNAHHLEIKLAARMADVRAMSSEVTINNVPCGIGQDWPGCHDVMERVLPAGATVTVKGTQRDGAEAFRHVYHGKGPSW